MSRHQRHADGMLGADDQLLGFGIPLQEWPIPLPVDQLALHRCYEQWILRFGFGDLHHLHQEILEQALGQVLPQCHHRYR